MSFYLQQTHFCVDLIKLRLNKDLWKVMYCIVIVIVVKSNFWSDWKNRVDKILSLFTTLSYCLHLLPSASNLHEADCVLYKRSCINWTTVFFIQTS